LSIQGREIHYLGKDYVALETESAQELLALYRCMNRGELKRLKRWPGELTSKTPDPSTKNLAANIQKTPAILELSPVKKDGKVEKSKKPSGRASSSAANQTDLFE
jgi:hypothetical protein